MEDIMAMIKAEEERRQSDARKKDLKKNSSSIVKCSNCRNNIGSEEILFLSDDKRKRSKIHQDSLSTSLRPWSELPDELIEIVVSKIKSADDCAHFRSVCMSWKEGFDKISRLSLPQQLPLLVSTKVFPFKPPHVPELRGTSTSSYNVKLTDIPAGYWCIGSSQGWLVFVEYLGEYYDGILLVNPFGEKHIRLPALKQYDEGPMKPGKVFKVVLSANPTWNKDYVVMAIYYGANYQFAFCRSGDETWTKMENQGASYIDDVIYYRNQIHIIDCIGTVFAVSNISSSPVLERVACKRASKAFAAHLYLVDLSGDLLVVHRNFDKSHNTMGFEVFKMNPTERVFTELEDLGDHLLFLGSISSTSVLASHFSGSHCSNRIYFDRDYNTPEVYTSPWDVGYFCLDDGYIRQICTPKTGHDFLWIEPQVATSLK